MERDVSIAFKASDRLSADLRRMQGNVKDLSHDVEQYRKIQDQAFRKKTEIGFDIRDAKQDLKDLEKAVKQNADGAREAFSAKRLELERLNEEYRKMTDVAKDASKAERQLTQDISRSSNANAGRSGGLTKGLATAGLGNMLSGAATNYLNATVTSVFGSTTGGMISNIGGSALSGAAMGSIAGPIGSAVGAAVGGLTGAINALSEKQTRQDDLFRNEVQGLYNDATGDMSNKLERGSTYAAEREMYKRNYASMTDDETGARLYSDIMKYGDDTPYDTSVMLGKGMEMLSYGIEKESIMESIDMLGNIAMGDTNKFSGLAYAYAQSMNAGILNGQDRRQMVGWGFDPLEYVAKNTGKSMSETMDMMSDGEITSDMLVDALRTATSEGERYHDAVNAMSDTFTGLEGQLESAKKNIEISMGDAFNETRKKGMEKEIEAYNGEMGGMMKEAYAMIGSYEAEMENRHQQSILDALEQANKDIADKGLEGLDAEKRMWEAYTDAEIAYKNTEEYEKRKKAEQDLVEKIQEEMIAGKDYLKYGIAMGEQFSKGYSGAVRDAIGSGALSGATADKAVKNYGNTGQKLWNHVNNAWKQSAVSHPHATGLDRVPYDGYPAILHEGERVLTRVEADQQRNGFGGVQIAKLADSIVVREEADIDRIATTIVRKLSAAAESYA